MLLMDSILSIILSTALSIREQVLSVLRFRSFHILSNTTSLYGPLLQLGRARKIIGIKTPPTVLHGGQIYGGPLQPKM